MTFQRTLPAAALAVLLLLGAGSSARAQGVLFVVNDRVGIGTDAPEAPLHILQAVGEPNIRLETQDFAGVRFELKNSSGEWEFIAGPVGNFNFNRVGVAGNQFTFTTTGNLIIQGSLSQGSSRSMKEAITAADGRAVLDKVIELPVAEWSYKDQSGRHFGPMAEDFQATFGLGTDPARLAPGDVAGVALAAIQGLSSEVHEKEQRIDDLERELVELRTLVAHLAAGD